MEINELELDSNGHLRDYTMWNKQVGELLAEQDGMILSEHHWQIINLVREIYLETENTPPMRLLIKVIRTRLSDDIANSRFLYQLFPDGPVKFASKYAGIPKPKHCM